MAITIDTITNNVQVDLTTKEVTGDGVFDKLMETATKHINAQFDKNRINGADYATVYLGMMQSVLAQSAQFALQKDTQSAQEALTNAQKDETLSKTIREEADNLSKIDVQEAQRLLYDRQREGFDDNKYQKLFETQMNSWGLMFSSGLLTQKPSIISSDKASELYNELTTDITAP